MRARDIMTSTVVSVSPGNSIRRATHIMLENGVSGVPVLDGEGTLVGMLTEGDLLRRCELGGEFVPMADLGTSETERARNFIKRTAWCVADVMSAPVNVVDQDASLGEICTLFLQKGIRRVPVVDNGRVVGIVSRHDVLKAIASAPGEACIGGDDRIQISFLSRLRSAADLVGPLPSVAVENGTIRLTGTVRSQAAKDAIRVIAESMAGGPGLDDQTRIQPQEDMAASS